MKCEVKPPSRGAAAAAVGAGTPRRGGTAQRSARRGRGTNTRDVGEKRSARRGRGTNTRDVGEKGSARRRRGKNIRHEEEGSVKCCRMKRVNASQPNMEQWSDEQLRRWQQEDATIKLVSSLKKDHVARPRYDALAGASWEGKSYWSLWDRLELRRGLLYRRWMPENRPSTTVLQLVAPPVIRREIMEMLHGGRTAGHLGIRKTLERVRQRFTWPGMRVDIHRWCRKCDACAQRKGRRHRRAGLQQQIVGAPWERVAIDYLGPLPTTERGNKYILVASDYFTKWTEAFALPTMTALRTADCLVTELFARFGVPRRLHSDQGTNFESQLFAAVCEALGIDKTRTTPYHPQSDGQVERFNRTVQDMLGKVVNQQRNDWDDHLPFVMAAYRGTVHESTGCSPNLLLFGREVGMAADLLMEAAPETDEPTCPVEYVEWLRTATREAHEYARQQLGRSALRQKKAYDSRVVFSAVPADTWVWYWYPPADRKLGCPWTGPYLVIRAQGKLRWIQRADGAPIRIVVVDELKPYEGENPPPRWATTDGRKEDESAEMERVIDTQSTDEELSDETAIEGRGRDAQRVEESGGNGPASPRQGRHNYEDDEREDAVETSFIIEEVEVPAGPKTPTSSELVSNASATEIVTEEREEEMVTESVVEIEEDKAEVTAELDAEERVERVEDATVTEIIGEGTRREAAAEPNQKRSHASRPAMETRYKKEGIALMPSGITTRGHRPIRPPRYFGFPLKKGAVGMVWKATRMWVCGEE
ncbi:PREDICTED: uncharacterized protein LOC106817443 [Priapulus caudatus]|uniref:RNA-directed DNA polymerase n=1 Tax=Priapulus caudatus TaxID=37621 RepID=A0ABM1EZH0_PRICU|nr:PREDICTED: uncharacterized protein LOC106817443 [Priapulus caudatus]